MFLLIRICKFNKNYFLPRELPFLFNNSENSTENETKKRKQLFSKSLIFPLK